MHLLLIFCLVCSFIVECPAHKPGECTPRGIRPTVCLLDFGCKSDHERPGAQKCCKYSSCMFVCETPIIGGVRPRRR